MSTVYDEVSNGTWPDGSTIVAVPSIDYLVVGGRGGGVAPDGSH